MNSRLFKFRIWDIGNKKLFNICNVGYYLNGNGSPHPDFVVMQFTGLLDKNKKEIYEGDIVKGKDFNGWNDLSSSFIGEVIFATHTSSWRLSDGKGYTPEINDTYKVIGNIFENPNLLATQLRNALNDFLGIEVRDNLKHFGPE